MQDFNCVNIRKNVMYISFYLKLTMNCMKKQGVSPRKIEKIFRKWIKMLKIDQNVVKIYTKRKIAVRLQKRT